MASQDLGVPHRLPNRWKVLFAVGLFTLACTEPDPPATHLAFLVQPPSVATRAEPLAPAIVVEVQDDRGNRVPTWNGRVSLILDTGTTGLSGERAIDAVAGMATFSTLGVTTVGTGFTLRAFAPGLAPATSATFEIKAGPGAKLAFTRQPRGVANEKITPAITVEVEDAGGYTATSASNVVTLSLANNPAGATLSGELAIAAVNGVATFNNVEINEPGEAYVFQATSAGLIPAVSNMFGIRSPFISVTAGYFHSCGLTNENATYCWGDVGLPSLVPGAMQFSSISSGRDQRCALTASGAAYCWTGSDAPAVVPGGITFASIAAGYQHSCGITSTGASYCWGENGSGELGNGAFATSANPVNVSGGHTFAQISAGRFFSCGVTTANLAYCWGTNSNGTLGTGTNANSAVPVAVFGELSLASVSAGGFHACALTSAGAAYCWGENGDGQLGDGTTLYRGTAVAVSGGLSFASLSAGNRHTCAVTAAGAAYCWGNNTDGMLGRAGPNSSVPVAVAGGLTFANVRAGRFHSCGIATSGDAYCWGSGANGLLGDDTLDSSSTPVRVP